MQGKTINGFTLQRLLGAGGMAEVWYAENEIGMKAAVKILSEKLSHDDQMQDRFLNEAKVMVQLDHPNIRKVHGYGSIDNRPAIIMEYLDGSDLKKRMKSGQHFTGEELKRWWDQMVDALNYTHQKGIVHRDIKPSNIFVDQYGNAKLLDFGIAKVTDTTSGTLTGSTLGTRIYMSPEQVKDPKRVGTASDVYSLAVSFVHLLTGKAPYDSTTSSDYDIQESIVRKPVDLSKVPEAWKDFLAPYLEKKPADRPALRPFGTVNYTPMTSTPDMDDETLSDEVKGDAPSYDKPSQQRPDSGLASTSPQPNDKPKNKKGLWIGLGIGVVALVAMMLLLLKPKSEPASSVLGSANGHEYVDLDLPSGTLWATCNVGASKPEGYGDYFAWGETETKDAYNWKTYKYGSNNLILTKYCNRSEYGDNGFVDNLTTLQAGDDPATAWGSGWHTPSKAQWDELLNYTKNRWTKQNGVAGRFFTSKKNGQSLFLPAAGQRCDSRLDYALSNGYYWSQSLRTDPDSAWSLGFGSGYFCTTDDIRCRSVGLSVRPVREK